MKLLGSNESKTAKDNGENGPLENYRGSTSPL